MKKTVMDGNAAVAYVSYALSQLAVIYPITPASPMAELFDEWSALGKKNLFDEVPNVAQMQSEAGAAGALHGAVTCGALTTTYTCSQGLLLMIPEMYKLAGELLPCVFHVSARAVSTHALSIFGDHQDVMACRQTGFAVLCASSPQEAMDFALLSHLVTLEARVPFLHFFDGFRTSHESVDVEEIPYEVMSALLNREALASLRERALDPKKPVQRGTAQNPDIYFQNREAANPYYLALPKLLQRAMDELAAHTKRSYRLFDYYGAPNAEHVLVLMGSAAYTARETVKSRNAEGEKYGVILVRLYRPFDCEAFLSVLPQSCQTVTVLDRTKEAGALGEPLYLDVCAALKEKGCELPVYGGRYGLGGKDFTPADVYAVLENAKAETSKNHFTVGIHDDVTGNSLNAPKGYDLPFDGLSCKLYGLGSDGTVGANKSTVKIVGEHTPLHVQGYFVYDSKKSGGVTISHLRFSENPVHAPYLIKRARFIACHNPSYLNRYDMLSDLQEGGIFLLNCPWQALSPLEENLPAKIKRQIAEKRARFFVTDATALARELGLEGKTSVILQTVFFYLLPELLPFDKAKKYLIEGAKARLSKKGEEILRKNLLCIERATENLREIAYPHTWATAHTKEAAPTLPSDEYFKKFMHPVLSLRGDELPTSAFAADGSVPTGTSKLEKHGAPPFLPKWLPQNCIQCNQCAFVCPHACIRPFLLTDPPKEIAVLPAIGEKSVSFRIQVSPDDCMGCGLCARVCPAKEKALVMTPSKERLFEEQTCWELLQTAKTPPLDERKRSTVKGSQFYPPLFEFSYACSGCGETPYIKLLTQLFGEKLVIANATGCSSIYGGSAPSCPYTKNAEGYGPAWASSLFEDNAEFGYGMRLGLEARGAHKDKSVWMIGGDGWAYDIGFSGLDHLFSSGANVNVLVLDSEVYSNTGGQTSKATPLGASARFAFNGKKQPKKRLGLMAMTYGSVYVAQVSMGANKGQLLKAFTEAESYEGVSLIIAYSPCIAHGVYLGKCMDEEQRAVESGYWPLFRYNPALKGKSNPFTLDSPAPTLPLREFFEGENRFAKLKKDEKLLSQAERQATELYQFYQRFAHLLDT